MDNNNLYWVGSVNVEGTPGANDASKIPMKEKMES